MLSIFLRKKLKINIAKYSYFSYNYTITYLFLEKD